MTDLLSLMFIVGIIVVFTIIAFIIKNTILAIVSGLGWTVSSIYLFTLVATGDADYTGGPTYGLAWIAVIMAMACFFSTWWLHRTKTEQMQKGRSFYDANFKDEYKDIEEIYEARRKFKNFRKNK